MKSLKSPKQKTHRKKSTQKKQVSSRRNFDAPWKTVIAYLFPYFLALCFPEIYAQIDWEKSYEMLDKELQKMAPESKTTKKVADMLFKVVMKNQEETVILIHFEAQGKKDDTFSQRMFTYYYRIYDNRQESVISIALLLDKNRSWRPDSFALKNPFSKDPVLQFSFYIIKLLDYENKEEELLEKAKEGNLFAFIFLAQLALMKRKKREEDIVDMKVGLIHEIDQLPAIEQEKRILRKFIDWIIMIPEDLTMKYKAKLDPDVLNWADTYVDSVEEAIIERKRHDWHQEGRQEGVLHSLEKLLQKRFGQKAVKYFPRLEQASTDSLQGWILNTLDASTLEEVFQN